jgi:hypothetical protein
VNSEVIRKLRGFKVQERRMGVTDRNLQIGLKPNYFNESSSSGYNFLDIKFRVYVIGAIIVLIISGYVGEMNDVNILLGRDVEEPILGSDLGYSLKVKQVITLYAISLDTGLGVELYLVLLDLSLLAHE